MRATDACSLGTCARLMIAYVTPSQIISAKLRGSIEANKPRLTTLQPKLSEILLSLSASTGSFSTTQSSFPEGNCTISTSLTPGTNLSSVAIGSGSLIISAAKNPPERKGFPIIRDSDCNLAASDVAGSVQGRDRFAQVFCCQETMRTRDVGGEPGFLRMSRSCIIQLGFLLDFVLFLMPCFFFCRFRIIWSALLNFFKPLSPTLMFGVLSGLHFRMSSAKAVSALLCSKWSPALPRVRKR